VRVTRANFGDYVWLEPVAEGMKASSSTLCGDFFLDQGRLIARAPGYPPKVAPETGPFELADFGKVYRLSWATGACAIPQTRNLKFCYWEQRFAAAIFGHTLFAVDAMHSRVLRLSVEDLFSEYNPPTSHHGRLWLDASRKVVEIPHVELLGLFDRASGPIDVAISETYPRRRAGSVNTGVVREVATKAMTVKLDDGRILAFPLIPGVVVNATLELFDELEGGVFHEMALAGQPKIVTNPRPAEQHVIPGELVVEAARDPAGGPIVTTDAPTRQADLDRLFHAIADDPSDPTTREVLVDLLEDSGEPYAAVMHELVSGSTDQTKRSEALGPLRYYLDRITYEGGLWQSATLLKDAPLDPGIGDAIAADQRLGLFHTLRIGDAPFAIYAKFVGSPRAVGLRIVDLSNAQVLAALIASKRTRLTHLMNVKFATRAVIEGLADPTFDSVHTIHTVTTAAIIEKQLEFFIRDEAGFFARAPRKLILTERSGDEVTLQDMVKKAWPKLPLQKITVGDWGLER
jgi:hypothetical protein